MRSVTQLLLLLKAWLFLVTVTTAAWAQERMSHVDPADLAWWTWGFIFVFASIGWAIAELDKMAEILFPEGLSPRQRAEVALKFAKGYIASLFAGVGMYFVTKVAPGWIGMTGEIPEMIALILVTASAFGGTRFLSWILARIGLAPA